MLRAVAAMRERLDSERGSALVVVIGLGFAFVIMGLTLAVVSAFASSTAGGTRARIQAQAAADAGIDNTIKQLNSVVMGKESSFRCSLTSTYATSHGTSDVVAQIKYHKVGDPEGTYYCNPATQFADNSEITGAEIVSTSTLTIGTGSGQRTVVKSVKQVVDLDMTAPKPPLFKYGFFSNGEIIANSGFTVDGGGVFTNGEFKCSSGASIYGDVVALGGAYITNKNCQVDSIWTGGIFKCDDGAKVLGDVIVASEVESYASKCVFGGDVWTEGPYKMQGATVGGNVLSATGDVTLINADSVVNGWAQAAGTVSGGTVKGARVPASPSAPPPAPVAESMPSITWQDLTGPDAGTPPVQTFGTWVKANAEANNAPSWSEARAGTSCQADGADYALNGPLVGPKVATIIDGRACDIVFRGTMKFALEADLTIVAKSFRSENGVTVVPGTDGTKHRLRIIVPLTPGAASCSGVSAGSISFANNGFQVSPLIDVMLYTNGMVEFNNDMSFTGAVYGCHTTPRNNVKITYTDMTPPGMETDGDANYNFRPVMRYDVRANG